MQPPESQLGALTVLRAGDAAGRLLGGCLSLVVCTLGTPFQPETHGTILFLEDRGERLYRLDRMLTHMRLAGMFDGVQGVVFGDIEVVEADRHPALRRARGDTGRARGFRYADPVRLSCWTLPAALDVAIWCPGGDSPGPPGVV